MKSKKVIRKRYRKITKKANEINLSNMDFVEAMAKKLKTNIPSLDLDDLIQAGRMGLIEAAQRYDLKIAINSGAKFKTYAYSWINKRLLEECKIETYKIHVPDKEQRKIADKKRIRNRLLQELGREPNYKEMAAAYSAKLGKNIESSGKIFQRIGMAEASVYSLDRRISDESDITFADVIEDPDRLEDTLEDLLPKQLSEVMNSLTRREQRILEVRFGIGKASSLEEVAREFGISADRVQRIEARALRKLRHPSRSRILKEFVK